jgi:CDGSH-type Zn-finger protein
MDQEIKRAGAAGTKLASAAAFCALITPSARAFMNRHCSHRLCRILNSCTSSCCVSALFPRPRPSIPKLNVVLPTFRAVPTRAVNAPCTGRDLCGLGNACSGNNPFECDGDHSRCGVGGAEFLQSSSSCTVYFRPPSPSMLQPSWLFFPFLPHLRYL